MAGLNKIATNFAQGLTAAEKQRARANIGATHYKRSVSNIYEAVAWDTSSDSQTTVVLPDTQFEDGHEYCLMLAMPSTIQFASYAKAYALLHIYIGANNYASAAWKLGGRVPVDNGTVKLGTTIFSLDWFGENLAGAAALDCVHIDFADIDSETTLVPMAEGQTLGFSLRGTAATGSYVAY